jgi:APA family basic amino acid/polyamine antiporter
LTASRASPGRQLGLVAATALVMGNMIGSGVFLLPASLAPFGWNAVGGWLITIAGALVLAAVLAKLTRALPEAGNATGFVGAAFGPLADFLIAWIYLVSVWTAMVTMAVAAVSYLSSFVPAIVVMPGGPALVALALLWLVVLVNLLSVRAAGQFQVVTLLIKLVPLVIVIVLAIGAFSVGEATIRPLEPETLTLTSVNGAAALTLWALLGFESASVAARQVRDPQVNVPRATLWGAGLTGLLYLFVCSAIALMLPADTVASSQAPFATFVERYWSPGPAALVAGFAVVSCVGALNGMVLLGGEIPRAMAEDRLLPSWLGATGGTGTPRRAILVSAAVASVFALMNGTRTMQGMFEYLLLLSTSATLWLYLACAMAALKLGIARGLAAIGAVYALWTLWGAGLDASGLSLVLMLAGLPLWWLSRRGRAVKAAADRYDER